MTGNTLRKTGSTLVITLSFLVLITILVVGLMDTVRTGNISANSNISALQAEYFAQSALERVVGTLQQQTAPQQSGSDTVYNWISQPGQLIIADAQSNGLPNTIVPLSSGSADTSLTGVLKPLDLNVSTFRDPSIHLITEQTYSGATLQMPVAWIYVRKSGALDTAAFPVTSNKIDPIIGRYAYWTDDESSKINYNLAWGRTDANTDPVGSPSRVDLTALSPLPGESRTAFSQDWANQLHQFISQSVNSAVSHGYYNTPKDARQVPNTLLAKALEDYKFELTHYNNDPDTTFFNEGRIVLTTQQSKVRKGPDGNLLPFIDILKTPDTDPGSWSVTGGAIDSSKLSNTINRIVSYLKRTDWPMAPGASIQSKYYGGDPDRLAQMALNIIDYVRCKESSEPIVNPIRVVKSNDLYTLVNSASDANYFSGMGRTPYFTELGVFVSGTTIVSSGTTGWPITLRAEVYLPPNYGIDQVKLTDFVLGVQTIYNNHYYSLGSDRIKLSEITGGAGGVLKAGEYAVLTRVYNNAATFIPASVTPIPNQRPSGQVKVRVSLTAVYGDYQNEANTPGDPVPLIYGSNDSITLKIDSPDVALEKITSCEVDDPRVNKSAKDWSHFQAEGTFGRPNSIFCSTVLTGTSEPQQDTNSDGTLSIDSMHMPPPKGKVFNGEDNTAGVVSSVGELGYVNTGMKGSIAGIPWRSLRLQPNSDPSGTVPDWALMDLFTVPVTISGGLKDISNGTSYAGRVNVNSHVQPFDLDRILPLAAVFQWCTYGSGTATLSGSDAQIVAKNIFNRTLAVNGKRYGFNNGYFSPGEIVEIKGIADRGEQSEELVRQVANLLTARGNVFTVYSIGQSLKQTPTGGLSVTGERRIQAMVERYLFDGTTGEVRFRTIYYRNLTP